MTAKRANSPADCAVADSETAGRIHVEPGLPPEQPFRLDRRRVLQSTAFRRLEYKTQVFVTHEHDHFRTRLTHTLEVAEISRTLAVALGVNEVLAETIALAHDLGHSPFGHAGEATLNELMQDDVLNMRPPGFLGQTGAAAAAAAELCMALPSASAAAIVSSTCQSTLRRASVAEMQRKAIIKPATSSADRTVGTLCDTMRRTIITPSRASEMAARSCRTARTSSNVLTR